MFTASRPPFPIRPPALMAAALLAMTAGGCSQGADQATPVTTNASGQDVEPPHMGAALARLPEFSGMRRLFRSAGLSDELADPGRSMTLLAARDTAFAQLSPESRAGLFQGAPPASLSSTLRGMMLPRILSSEELRTRIIEGGGTFTTPSMAGSALTFRLNGDQIIVTAANGASANMGNGALTTGNGAIYILDRWIGPGV